MNYPFRLDLSDSIQQLDGITAMRRSEYRQSSSPDEKIR